ncbi:hypothetical protein E4U59_001339 [Claviceps monticola]|nr:hypothetical protein E4U59_001339 [Claviceps monticola]
MQFLTFLLASASVGFATASPAAQSSVVRNPFPGNARANWCNHGWSSDGICEEKGLNTYCCTHSQRDHFDTWRNVQGDPIWKMGNCPTFGLVACA